MGKEKAIAFENALRDAHISFFTGAGSDKWLLSFHIANRDVRRVVDEVANEFGGREDLLVEFEDGTIHRPDRVPTHPALSKQKKLKLLCVEKDVPDHSIMACSWIEISIWREIPRYGTDKIFETATNTPHFRRLRASTLERFLSENVDIDQLDPMLNAVPQFPIDVVYTWVDDKDPDWQDSRAQYSGVAAQHSTAGRSNLDERFTNRDELKYSLRSLELFAPFVRNIFIVTSGHIPSWINVDHPQIKMISHSEIFSRKDFLPTFNSSGIETQLHHIPELSENFIYFNDDFFLGEFCTPEDFFQSNGVVKYFNGDQKSFEHDIDETSEEYIAADKNAIELLKRDYGTFTRELMEHAPYPASKSLIEEMEARYQAEFDRCASHRFRSQEDLRPIAFMQYHYGYMRMKTVKSSISNRYLALWKPNIDQMLQNMLKNRAHKTFCINDVGIPPSRLNWTNRLVKEFLDQYFPFKSSFEK